MDHIVRCMLDIDANDDLYIESNGYPDYHNQPNQNQQSQQAQPKPKQDWPPAEDKPKLRRLHSQSERKYQLFPKDTHQPSVSATGKGLDPEQAYALAMGASSAAAAAGDSGLRLRTKEQSAVRRRKISVPDLGPMTTVQEASMDSPTIPGRPPLHERSISAPGNSWKKHHLVDCMLPRAYDDIPEQGDYMSFSVDDLFGSPPEEVPRCSSAEAVLSPTVSAMAHSPSPQAVSPKTVVRQSLSPKVLAPLVIPRMISHSRSHSQLQHQNQNQNQSQNRNHHQMSASLSSSCVRSAASASTPLSAHNSRFRSSSTAAEHTLRSARSDESPRSRTPFTPYAPMSAVSTTSTLPTPVSATATSATATATATDSHYTISASKDNAASATTGDPAEPRSTVPSIVKISTMPATATLLGHHSSMSDTGSIMERGRPRKRRASRETSTSAAISAMVTAGHSSSDASPAPSARAPASASTAGLGSATATPAGHKRSASKGGMKNAAERRAFEMLPRGWKASDAPSFMDGSDIAALASQALQQAARFEVLRREDVDSLSRELRSLDERCEYLRRTYTSLRAGRRNLHGRICHYLRSPRVAKFSHDSMLKQEEALAELDTSIDDWVTKLEQADNRRTRVRQKLLEHVAAAATLPLTSSLAAVAVAAAGIVPAAAVTSALAPSAPLANGAGAGAGAPAATSGNGNSSSSSKHAGQQAISTPPRSPTKMAPPTLFSSAAASAASSIISPVASASPLRPVVAQVPSTILEQPLVEEAMATIAKSEAAAAAAAAASAAAAAATAATAVESAKSEHKPAAVTTTATADPATDTPLSPASTIDDVGRRRLDVESIRIYVGDDVYALLADVENQITQMGDPVDGTPTGTADSLVPQHTHLTDEERRELHRARSEELLNGGGHASSKRSTPTPPASPRLPGPSSTGTGSKTTAPAAAAATSSSSSGASSPADNQPEPEIFLTDAVFRPGRSILAI